MGHYGNGYDGGWAPYVPVAERRRRALKKMESLRKKGVDVQPITIDGRKIVQTFWGEAWCDHLESFSDFENRLPRGRTYVRNGSVCHLAVAKGKVVAKVSGSELYDIEIAIETLAPKKWKAIKARCGGQIGSLLELLQGRLSDEVMQVVTDRNEGLFPLPGEISMQCSCPDWATMCKHVAAVLYGVGSRLDNMPEMLFLLRGVKHEELIEADAEKALTAATSRGKSKRLAADTLGEVFGIEIDTAGSAAASNGGGFNGAAPKQPSSDVVPIEPTKAAKKVKAIKAATSAESTKPGKSRAKKAVGKTEESASVTANKKPKKSPAGKARTKPAAA